MWVNSHRVEPNMFGNSTNRPGTVIVEKDIFGAYYHDFNNEYLFFNDFISGKLTSTESATRVRRQLQAKYPELRDKETYETRMKRSVLFKQEFSSRYNFEGAE